ncbi:MAG TPA: SRPBCC family protein [Gaiellaceae bacterium]|nr:SRPBCC family protein [Gaiellaceae bacterium]
MIEVTSETDVQRSAETIFDVIVDFRGQDRWLPKSSVFRGTTEISSDPVKLATTYREPGLPGIRRGTVTELERPTKLTCHQPLTMRLRVGTVDATLRYTLTPTGSESTHVRRAVTLGIPWSLKLVQPVLVRAFRRESERTLLALKAYAETLT